MLLAGLASVMVAVLPLGFAYGASGSGHYSTMWLMLLAAGLLSVGGLAGVIQGVRRVWRTFSSQRAG